MTQEASVSASPYLLIKTIEDVLSKREAGQVIEALNKAVEDAAASRVSDKFDGSEPF